MRFLCARTLTTSLVLLFIAVCKSATTGYFTNSFVRLRNASHFELMGKKKDGVGSWGKMLVKTTLVERRGERYGREK